MYVPDRLVTREFRQIVMDCLPILTENPAYRRLTLHILFGSWFDEDTDELLISQEMLACIEGKERLLQQHNYRAQDFLEAYSRDVFPISWSGWRYVDGQCRRLTSANIPTPIRDALEHEYASLSHDRISFMTGCKHSPAHRRQLREEAEANAYAASHLARTPVGYSILSYMNQLHPHYFTRFLQYTDEAKQIAIGLETGSRRALNTIYTITAQPQPFYKPVKSSDRVFPANTSLLTVNGKVRKAFTRDCVDFDLASAQLAIAAAAWPLPLSN